MEAVANALARSGNSASAQGAQHILEVQVPTLSKDAEDIFMTHRCPRCGHRTTRQGSSFRSIRHYHCSVCGEQVRLTYEDKLKLFREHAGKSVSAV
jgi:DNA-directed RNA polymerase subunit RPC12/RpoP